MKVSKLKGERENATNKIRKAENKKKKKNVEERRRTGGKNQRKKNKLLGKQ
jgi:hypothetical protein